MADPVVGGAGLVGVPTGRTTTAGRPVYQTQDNQNVSELSVTLPFRGWWVNVPSIHNGVRYNEDKIVELLDAGVIKPTSMHKTVDEAVTAAKNRSAQLLPSAEPPAPQGAAFGIYPSAGGRRTVRPRVGLLDRTYTGEPAQPDLAPRVRPQPEQPPAEMREYQPTMRESAAARAQETLQSLGVERAGARRMAQTVLGGPSSNLPLGLGLIDVPLLPSVPFLAQEGYRGTERAMSAAQRGDYGTAAMEYLGAATMLAPGVAVAPAVAREVKNVVGKAAADAMGIGSRTRQNQRGVFLPPKFFSPQEKARISTAEKLERDGMSPDEVLVQTGLLRDLDGTWAVEISDDKMKFKGLEAVRKARQSVINRITALEDARDIRARVESGISLEDAIAQQQAAKNREIHPFARGMIDDNLDVLDSKIENAYSTLQAPIRGLKLKDVIEHPELFDRIPELAEMQVDFVTESELGKGVGGHFDPDTKGTGTGTIRVRSQYARSAADEATGVGRSVTAHEVQHAVDYGAGKDYGISPETIRLASEYWKQQEPAIRAGYNVEKTALYARELMDKNPGMTAEQALDKTLETAWHYGESKDYAKAGVTLNPENFNPYTEDGQFRDMTINIIQNVSADELQRRAERAAQALRENQLKRHIADPTEAGRGEQYMLNQGEARARLAQTRLDLTPEERQQIFPMREQFMGLDRPPENLKTRSELTGGRYGPKLVSAAPAAMRQRGAIDLGPRPTPLGEALADQPTTLRVLENLPGKRTTVTEQELREQMRRPEVTKAEKDVLERVISRMQGGNISAQQLVREVGLETAPYRLEPVESGQFAEYGLNAINRSEGDYNYDTMRRENKNMENARTTIYRSPTETSADNHFDDPNYFGHTRAFEANGIPHVVEIQSDLVQNVGKELTPEERLSLEQGNAALDAQTKILNDFLTSEEFTGYRGYSRNYAGMADKFEKSIPLLEAANEDFKLVFGQTLSDERVFRGAQYQSKDPADLVDDVMRILRSNEDEFSKEAAANALSRSMRAFRQDLQVRKGENTSKLVGSGAAEAQRPMFKNWERRLIREELSRAATPQQTPEYMRLRNQAKTAVRQLKEAEEYYRSNGLSDNEIAALTRNARTDAEWFAKAAQETLQYKPIPSVVRFADADTVAKIEGWPEVNETQRDNLRRMIEEQKTIVEQDEQLVENARAVGADEDTMIRLESSMGHGRATLRALQAELQRSGGDSTGRFHKQHQGIYDRYNKEVANYLKSLGGKHVKDEYGHGWWEVPVKPQQRRTQIFSMGGGTVAAGGVAAYNAPSAVEEQ